MRKYKCPNCSNIYSYPESLRDYEACHFGAVCQNCKQCFTVYLILGEVLIVIPWNNTESMRRDIRRGEIRLINDEKFGKFYFAIGT